MKKVSEEPHHVMGGLGWVGDGMGWVGDGMGWCEAILDISQGFKRRKTVNNRLKRAKKK